MATIPLIDSKTAEVINNSIGADNILDLSLFPKIFSGTDQTATDPTKIGDLYYNTSTDKLYVAKGTNKATDWVILN